MHNIKQISYFLTKIDSTVQKYRFNRLLTKDPSEVTGI